MNTLLTNEEKQLIDHKYMPAVSIILPFDPKMSVRSELEYKLKIVQGKVEKELIRDYPSEKAFPVIHKLQNLILKLNYDTHKKSIALFISPLVDKVFYLDIALEERIVIDESFEIRDLIYSKKQTIQYLVLLLSGKSSKVFLGNCSKFILIKTNKPDNIEEYERDMPERITNFSDPKKHKEILLEKFLHHMDEGLSQVLKAYPLPVFVMGSKKVLGLFKKLSVNEKNIIHFIHGNYDSATEQEIREHMRPYITDWKLIKEQVLLQEIEKAKENNSLSVGIQNAWHASTHKNNRLLVVEKDFIFPARHSDQADQIFSEDLLLDHPFYIKDAVDDIMEKVLDSGGDIEFVDHGVLENYEHIVLIRHY